MQNPTTLSDLIEDTVVDDNTCTNSKVYVLFHNSENKLEIPTFGCKVRLYEPSFTNLNFAGICQKSEIDSQMVDKVLLCAFMYETLNEDR